MKNDIQLNALAVSVRSEYGYSNKEPINIENLLALIPNCTLIEKEMSGNISGLCVKDGESVIIAVNVKHSLGRVRFSIAHEIYHMIDRNLGGSICGINFYDKKSDVEMEADTFASYLLMPYDGLEWYCHTNKIEHWNICEIVRLSQYYQMSYVATLYRLQREDRITTKEFEEYRKYDIQKLATQFGWTRDLYLPAYEIVGERVIGEYPRLLQEKYSEGKMTDGLFHQLCRECMIENYYNAEGREQDGER